MTTGIILVLSLVWIIYYTVKYEWYYALSINTNTTIGRLYFLGFLISLVATVFVQFAFVLQTNDSWPEYSILFYAVFGSILDLVWADFPGTGALCLTLSQLLFALRASQNNNVVYTSIGFIIFGTSVPFFLHTWYCFKATNRTIKTTRKINMHY
jgi:hypothetical protein